MGLRYSTFDVFTDRPFGGNPLAVFCDQPDLPDELMLRIAREFNLSETVFIVPPRDPRALRRLRIFTPVRELPFAGHPTIGAANYLVESGIAKLDDAGGSFVLELEVGLTPIQVTRNTSGPPFLQLTTARLPEGRKCGVARAEIARALSLKEADLVANDRDFAHFYSCGVPFLFVPVVNRAAVARATPDTAAWHQVLKSEWSREIFVFAREGELPGSQIHGRMFAPEFSIIEDPATGSAAASLAGYLADREPGTANGTLKWIVEQGFEMGRPSLLHVEADKTGGKISAVRVGGTAVRMSDGALTISAT